MTLKELNELPVDEAINEFEKCCGSKKWIIVMTGAIPYYSKEELLNNAEETWNGMEDEDVMEVFDHHSKIGDLSSLKEKFANTKNWSKQEQEGLNTASEDEINLLAQGNIDYEKKFGFIFLIFATGKSPEQMLEALQSRIGNTKEQELVNVRQEQLKITLLRLNKLLEN